ncbi:MAG TPA: hypothetical protein VFZ25_02195 [Chloroflexota bacterium]|nr:hypothetical protein [Chloroflexota bacterium]
MSARDRVLGLWLLVVAILVLACGPASDSLATSPVAAAGTPTPEAVPSIAPLVRSTATATSVLAPTPAPSPSPSAAVTVPNGMTVYSVANPGQEPLRVEHVITNASGFRYAFWSDVPPRGTGVYHLRDMTPVPHPFQGTLTLYANQPFTAQLVGYDYPDHPGAGNTSASSIANASR